jgi:hypothetical protein
MSVKSVVPKGHLLMVASSRIWGRLGVRPAYGKGALSRLWINIFYLSQQVNINIVKDLVPRDELVFEANRFRSSGLRGPIDAAAVSLRVEPIRLSR